MDTKASKRLLAKIAIITAIAIFNTTANGGTNQNFNALLNAYTTAKIKYKLANVMQDFSEMSYWSEQYNFYRSKITQLLNNAEQAALQNPQASCLQALKMFSKYSEANSSVLLLDGMESPMDDFNRTEQLAKYCSRYDIYYDPYKEKM